MVPNFSQPKRYETKHRSYPPKLLLAKEQDPSEKGLVGILGHEFFVALESHCQVSGPYFLIRRVRAQGNVASRVQKENSIEKWGTSQGAAEGKGWVCCQFGTDDYRFSEPLRVSLCLKLVLEISLGARAQLQLRSGHTKGAWIRHKEEQNEPLQFQDHNGQCKKASALFIQKQSPTLAQTFYIWHRLFTSWSRGYFQG